MNSRSLRQRIGSFSFPKSVPQHSWETFQPENVAQAPLPEKSLRNLDSWHHQGSAIPRFGESAVPCRIYSTLKSFRHTTLVNHHSMPQILSALGKMIGTTQNACLSLRPPSRLHWLDQPSKDDNAIHNLDSYLSPRLSSIPLHHEESCYRYAAKPLFYFQPRPHKPLAG